MNDSLSASVFVVDDDQDARQGLVALVTSLGYTAEEFDSAEAFLAAVPADRPGCAVVDYRLAGISGIELHQRMKLSGFLMPVVLVSGYLTVRTAIAALEHGVFRVLEKPYTAPELAAALDKARQWGQTHRNSHRFRLDTRHRLQSLLVRERTTLDMILAGHPNKVIERRLGVSRRTVERIRNSILDKMDTLSFVELASRMAESQLDLGHD